MNRTAIAVECDECLDLGTNWEIIESHLETFYMTLCDACADQQGKGPEMTDLAAGLDDITRALQDTPLGAHHQRARAAARVAYVTPDNGFQTIRCLDHPPARVTDQWDIWALDGEWACEACPTPWEALHAIDADLAATADAYYEIADWAHHASLYSRRYVAYMRANAPRLGPTREIEETCPDAVAYAQARTMGDWGPTGKEKALT